MSALATNSDKPHPIGGRRGAWPGFKTRAWPQCRWAAARPGWASPSDTSAAGLEGTGVPEGTCRGTGGRRRSQDDTQTTSAARLDAAAEPGQASRHGPGRGGGGGRGGQAGRRGAAPTEVRSPSLAGGPPPTGKHSGPAHQGRPRGGRGSGGATSTAGNQAVPQAPAGKVRTPRSTPGSGRPGGRRVARAR